jgi:hypothetical protein
MGNVQKHNSCINIPSSQTFRSYLLYLTFLLIIIQGSDATSSFPCSYVLKLVLPSTSGSSQLPMHSLIIYPYLVQRPPRTLISFTTDTHSPLLFASFIHLFIFSSRKSFSTSSSYLGMFPTYSFLTLCLLSKLA